MKRSSFAASAAFGCASETREKGRNPKTGDSVAIPAKRVAYFKPGKELKELINQNDAASTAEDQGTAESGLD